MYKAALDRVRLCIRVISTSVIYGVMQPEMQP